MTGLVFAALLAGLLWGLERYSKAHCLDEVEGVLAVEDCLAEPGEPARLLLTVRNRGRHFRPFVSVALHLAAELAPCGSDHIRKDSIGLGHTARFVTWLRPKQEVTYPVEVCAARRGRYVLEPLAVGGGDFLGLSETVRRERGFCELLVPPKEADCAAVRAQVGGFLGAVSVNRYLYDDPVLTAGVRPYASGDPMSRIAWKQSARGRGLMVKKPDYTTEPRAVVLVHADHADEERAEACYSLARTVCRVLEDRAVAYRFVINTKYDLLMNFFVGGAEWTESLEATMGFGPEHYRRVLELLSRTTGASPAPLEDFFAENLRRGEQCSCIVVTTLDEAAVRAALPPLPESTVLVLTADAPPKGVQG